MPVSPIRDQPRHGGALGLYVTKGRVNILIEDPGQNPGFASVHRPQPVGLADHRDPCLRQRLGPGGRPAADQRAALILEIRDVGGAKYSSTRHS